MEKDGKRLGILTFHWADDFGAMLQTYGLKSYLHGLGYRVEVVPYSNSNLEGRYRFLPKQVAEKNRTCFIGDYNVRKMLRNIKHFKRFYEKKRNMNYFRRKYLTNNRNSSRPEKLRTELLDVLIIGSDQVWNPELTIGLDPVYMGRVPLKEGARVISYGASFGSEGLTQEAGKELGALLERDFAAISVREKSAIPFLSQFVTKEIVAVPDPTLLADRSVWDCLLQEPKREAVRKLPDRYIVYQSTEHNEKMIQFARELGRLYGEPVYDIRRLPNGPIQFLQMMAGAHFVVTNSFHGTVFATLFEKQFVTFAHSDKNARLRDLLQELGLEDRLAETHEVSRIEKPVCWEQVRSRIRAFQGTGEAFLRLYLEER